jgi:hypothetical protein
MNSPTWRAALLGLSLLVPFVAYAEAARGQGVVWKLPEPGAWVRYEGDYTQTEARPNDPLNQDLPIGPWRRHLTVKALDRVQDTYAGVQVEAQWLEFLVETGLEKDGMLVTGPGGRRLYKILVPVEETADRIGGPKDGAFADSDGILTAFLPMIRGYRQIGDGAVEPLPAGMFSWYPNVTLLAPYRGAEVVAENENPEVSLPGVSAATHYRAELTMETLGQRVVNQADMWAADAAPFGLVRWEVTVSRQAKPDSAARDAFRQVSQYGVKMKAVAGGQDATSQLTEN